MTDLAPTITQIKNTLLCIGIFFILLITAGCQKVSNIAAPAPVLAMSTLVSGLNGPIGLETDESGRVWVAESGTGKCDGRISVITPDGKIYPVITNFESVITSIGETEGPTHLLFNEGCLFILGANGKMYIAHVSDYKNGDAPIKAASLKVEDIGAFVLAYNFVDNAHDTHPYNLTVGFDGAIYIVDAAANAILRRAKNGALSVLAEIPGYKNPTPVGPPFIQSVPTGIIYDGDNFLVTTLTGFPFLTGKAIIYQVGQSGLVSVYQQGFTTLVDIAAGANPGHLVLEHGEFGQMGFIPNSGKLVWANGKTATTLLDGLNLPAGLKQADMHTWYVTILGDGSILKITY